MVQPLNMIFNEASDEEGKLNYSADLDVLIIKWLLVTQVDWLFLSLLSLHLCIVSISFDPFQVKSVKMRLLFTPCWRLLNNNKIPKTEWFGEDEQESPYKNFEILDCDILWYGKYTFLKNLLYHWFSRSASFMTRKGMPLTYLQNTLPLSQGSGVPLEKNWSYDKYP